MMKQVREQLERVEPDLIIEVDSDHFVNFFYNNLPSFCIGMAEEAEGPQESWCPMPRYTVRGNVSLAKALFRYGVHNRFDLAAAHELRLDHSLVVPLHFLNPGMVLPVVPIYTNGFASPLPPPPALPSPPGSAGGATGAAAPLPRAATGSTSGSSG